MEILQSEPHENEHGKSLGPETHIIGGKQAN